MLRNRADYPAQIARRAKRVSRRRETRTCGDRRAKTVSQSRKPWNRPSGALGPWSCRGRSSGSGTRRRLHSIIGPHQVQHYQASSVQHYQALSGIIGHHQASSVQHYQALSGIIGPALSGIIGPAIGPALSGITASGITGQHPTHASRDRRHHRTASTHARHVPPLPWMFATGSSTSAPADF